MSRAPSEYSHCYSGPELLAAMNSKPFPSQKWEAAQTTQLDSSLVLKLADALKQARFALVPPALLRPDAKVYRSFVDLAVERRYGTSLVQGLEPEVPTRAHFHSAFSCPALSVSLPPRQQDPLQVRPGFLKQNGEVYFWDGQNYLPLKSPLLSVFTYWKTA